MKSSRNLFILLWTSMLVHQLFPSRAQENNRTVSGYVHTAQNTPLEGVTVILVGTQIGGATDSQGRFVLQVPQELTSVTLSFSYKGYVGQTVEVGDRDEVSVTLSAVSEDLDEVVVIGYGTAKRKDLTGAVASIQATKLETEAPRSIQDLLRGNAAGMIIGQGRSAKGDASLLIRGSGTLKAGNSPLNVVDGVIFDGALADINPNDIESIDILKDASAAAVFGARAANGVVLITTKRGARGKSKISFNSNVGFVENASMPRVMTPEEFLEYRYDYQVGRRTDQYHQDYPEMFVDPRILSQVSPLDWYNYDQNTAVTDVTEEQLLRTWLARLELRSPEIDNYMSGVITDWQDLVFRRGLQQDHSVSISNRTDDINYYWSLNYVDREGIIVGNRFKNLRSRLNLESTITSFLKIGANANFAARNEGFLQADWGQSAVISPYGSNNIGDPESPYRRLPTGDVTPQNP